MWRDSTGVGERCINITKMMKTTVYIFCFFIRIDRARNNVKEYQKKEQSDVLQFYGRHQYLQKSLRYNV